MQYTRPATVADCRYLAPRLRADDVREIKACTGHEPLTALLEGLGASVETFVMLTPEGPSFGIAGVAQHPDSLVGIIWMVTTPEIEQQRFRFLRRAREVVNHLNGQWPVLTNAVDARNVIHINLLQWLGFTFLRRIEHHGVEQRPFIEFARILPCAH